MNENELSRLLDDAAAGFNPTADVTRLERMLPGRGMRRRGAVIVFSAAACLAMMGGAVAAVKASPEPRLAPAHETETTRESGPRTTEPKPTTTVGERDGTEPPRSTTPRTEPAWDEPKATEPVATEPAAVEPTATEPKPTEPPKPPKPPTSEAPPTTEHKPETTEPPPSTEATVPVPWTAFQVYGSGSGSPPSDVFYGTAKPGAKIVIEAEYGRVVGYANDNGQWELHIQFPESPIGEAFKVFVVSGDNKSTFWFTHTAAD